MLHERDKECNLNDVVDVFGGKEMLFPSIVNQYHKN